SSGPQGKNRTFASLYQDWYYTRAILSILGFDVEQKFNGPYRERALIWRDGRVQTLEDILTKLHWTCSDFDQKSIWYLWAENAARKKMWNPHKIPPENPDAEKDLLNLKQINIKTYMSYIEAHLVDINLNVEHERMSNTNERTSKNENERTSNENERTSNERLSFFAVRTSGLMK
ncbi:hypothetical protein F5880DRAFT_1512630, partial [Lentinula raphanica]